MTGTTAALVCADCGKPVHPVHGGEACGICGEPVYYHDGEIDSLRCRGTSPHIRAAEPFAGSSALGEPAPAGQEFTAPVTRQPGGPLALFSAAMRRRPA